MTIRRVVLSTVVCTALSLVTPSAVRAQVRMYNTVKQKLMEGKPVIGGTISTSDPNIYCAMANAGFDYLWIEMQHSPLTYNDVAKMIWAVRTLRPFLSFACRTPQKATSRKRPTSALWVSPFPWFTQLKRLRMRSSMRSTRPWGVAAGAVVSTVRSGERITVRPPTTTS